MRTGACVEFSRKSKSFGCWPSTITFVYFVLYDVGIRSIWVRDVGRIMELDGDFAVSTDGEVAPRSFYPIRVIIVRFGPFTIYNSSYDN